MTLEKLQKCAPNELDTVEEHDLGFSVEFNATVDSVRPVVAVNIHDDIAGVVFVSSSSCLTSTHWLHYAEAYGRLAEFMHLSGLRDYR